MMMMMMVDSETITLKNNIITEHFCMVSNVHYMSILVLLVKNSLKLSQY